MTTNKLARGGAVSTVPACTVQTTPRARIVFGDAVLGTFGTVGRAVGAPLKDIPAGAKVLDAKGRVRARLDHFVTTRGTTIAGWFLVEVAT